MGVLTEAAADFGQTTSVVSMRGLGGGGVSGALGSSGVPGLHALSTAIVLHAIVIAARRHRTLNGCIFVTTPLKGSVRVMTRRDASACAEPYRGTGFERRCAGGSADMGEEEATAGSPVALRHRLSAILLFFSADDLRGSQRAVDRHCAGHR